MTKKKNNYANNVKGGNLVLFKKLPHVSSENSAADIQKQAFFLKKSTYFQTQQIHFGGNTMKKVFIPLAVLFILCMVSSLCQAQVRGITIRTSHDAGWARQVAPGYQLLDVDLNKGCGRKSAYVYMSYSTVAGGAPITDLMVIEGKNAPPPPGWGKIDSDLNSDAGGAYLYLCYRTGGGAPITDLFVSLGDTAMPPGWQKIPVDLNKGAGGDYIYLWYKK